MPICKAHPRPTAQSKLIFVYRKIKKRRFQQRNYSEIFPVFNSPSTKAHKDAAEYFFRLNLQLSVAAFDLKGGTLKKMSKLQASSKPATIRNPIQACRHSRASSKPKIASWFGACRHSQASSKNTAGIFILEVSIDALRMSPSTRVLSSCTLSPSIPRTYSLNLSAFLFFSLNDSFAV